jgi:hypothetical protein
MITARILGAFCAFTTLGCALAVLPGCNGCLGHFEDNNMSLTIENAGSDFVLVVRNESQEAMVLDRQLLAPELSVHIYGPNGIELPKLPPPMPVAAEARPTTVLSPGQTRRDMFRLRELIDMRPLDRGEYAIEAKYDATHLPRAASDIFRGPVTSNRAHFTLPLGE